MTSLTVAANEKDPSRLASTIRQLSEGRSNATGTCTLTANVTSTLVTAPNCSTSSVVFLAPTTTNAAAAVGTTFYAAANGSFTLTHANTATTNRVFGYVCLG